MDFFVFFFFFFVLFLFFLSFQPFRDKRKRIMEFSKKDAHSTFVYQDQIHLKSERDRTRKPSSFNFYYHQDDVLPWIDFLDSDLFWSVAANEKEKSKFDFSNEKEQREMVVERCEKHCQEMIAPEEGGGGGVGVGVFFCCCSFSLS